MLDKNPNNIKLGEVFADSVNSILCHDGFAKEAIIAKIIKEYDIPTIYLDLDLLYSGYVQSDIIKKQADVLLFTPDRKSWNDTFKEIIERISSEEHVLMVDSLNGFFTLFDDKNSGRYCNSCMMMLASMSRNRKSKIFLSSVAKLRGDGWILYPTGRHVLENRSISKFFVSTDQIEILSAENQVEKIIKI